MAKSSRTVARFREARSLELALDGAGWDDIAERLGYADRSGAWRAAQRGLARRTVLAANDYFSAMLVEAECVRERFWPDAMRGDIAAAELVLAAMDRSTSLMARAVGPGTSASQKAPLDVRNTKPPSPSAKTRKVPADWDSGKFTSF